MKDSIITLHPTSFNGTVKAPPSKSLSHRALICAGLSNGTSVLENIVYSEDVIATMNALKQLGVSFIESDTSLTVKGVKTLQLHNNIIDCNESGSTIRFLIPLFSLLDEEVIFTGKESLLNRPQSVYQRIFDEQDLLFEQKNNTITLKGPLTSKSYYLEGDISSQFFSGLLFALPLLEEDSSIYYTTNLESKSYIDLTINTLKDFGITITEIENGYFIKGNQKYTPANFSIEGDYSQAAFFLVAGAISGHVESVGLEHNSAQGDREIVSIIRSMQGRIITTENGFITQEKETKGRVIDIQDCPDLGPIISLLASVSKGKTTIKNAHRLRIKESDRIFSTVQTLQQLGANITTEEDNIVVKGRSMLQGGVTIDSFNDHRIAMMVSIAVSKCVNPVVLERATAVNKSYPHFFEDYQKIGGLVSKGD